MNLISVLWKIWRNYNLLHPNMEKAGKKDEKIFDTYIKMFILIVNNLKIVKDREVYQSFKLTQQVKASQIMHFFKKINFLFEIFFTEVQKQGPTALIKRFFRIS